MLHDHKETIPSPVRDYPEWHRGRREYSVWLIELEGAELVKKVEAAREHLSEFLQKPYLRQPHITLFACGFLTDIPFHPDDYSTKQLETHLQKLHESKVCRFSIRIGKLNSFASAPFFEVEDLEGGIARVREILSASAPEIGRDRFTPHITVGLYSSVFPSAPVGREIASFSSTPLVLTIERITFASYQAREIAGTLTYRAEVVLSRQ
jgi:2'-5' RNA ligase